MIKNFSTLASGLALACCLAGSASAQQMGSPYDYSTSTQYRTYTRSYNWTPDARSNFDSTVQAQSNDLYPIFWQGRTDLWPILTPQQRVIYDSYQTPQSYYGLGLMDQDQYLRYQANLAQRLNLTSDQMNQYETIQNRVWTSVTPVQQRYQSRYSSNVAPEEWQSYRTQVTGPYFAGNNSMNQSNSEIVERRVRVETTQTVPIYNQNTTRTTQNWQTRTPVRAAPAGNWRNQDLK